MESKNCYEDTARAAAYAKLEFPGTYYLAYRDLPKIILEHTRGRNALDFGCGTGRSARFLKQHGFAVTGVDISQDMLAKAILADPQGDYRLIREGELSRFPGNSYDLVLSAFTFDNIPSMERKIGLFREIGRLLDAEGRIVNLVSAPEIYVHEWASFSTKDFPENKSARSGDIVKVIVTDLEDRRPVEDIFWTDESYEKVYQHAGLEQIAVYRPLGLPEEPYQWINETRIAPWTIYVLKRKD